jgi:hypothetical protein
VIALPRKIHHKKRQQPQVDAPDSGTVGLGPSHFEHAKRHERASNTHGNAPTDIREADEKQIPPQKGTVCVIRPKFMSIKQVSFFAEFFRHNFFLLPPQPSVGYEQRITASELKRGIDFIHSAKRVGDGVALKENMHHAISP